MAITISVLDTTPVSLATEKSDVTAAARSALRDSVKLAQRAEELDYHRVWYTEHHGMPIASSATAVVIGHVATQTSKIRLGAGGVMLPNHAPLVIAEQFGTLEALHPGRIDLGLGRAPGSDQATMRALRRDLSAADTFPSDVVELQRYLTGKRGNSAVRPIPGEGSNVPLFILGSSLFGAQLAARLGLPYAFASHFVPNGLQQALETYRSEFTPSEQLAKPYAMAAVNLVAARTFPEAQEQFTAALRSRVRLFAAPGGRADLSDEQVDSYLATPGGQRIASMLRYTALGGGRQVREYLDEFAAETGIDELLVAPLALTGADRLTALKLARG